ncbi:uncharacterized protein LOC131995879 [Stomoxys calcitrans]|uniref:uncharacterized protein LOC131995879 n=1 Tax=Stomoxys calcitrans TaxID=35570 RepID=UPI0027E33DC9|nr:uncharacterized protein LOC131995879 [Stomoxys calcitrans]
MLSELLESDKSLKFLSYADDFVIIKELSRLNQPIIDLNNTICAIEDWCNYSGAELSIDKCKHLHICRKRNCSPVLNCNNYSICPVNKLKILGITFNSKYKWDSHIEELSTSLSKRLNIIKCLSNKNYSCDTSTLITITRSVIVSKISYGIYLYGYTSKALLNKIKTTYNSAVRLSLGAHRTTKIFNLLFEANLKTIEDYRDIATAQLIKTILFNDKTPLMQMLNKALKTKKFYKTDSAIGRIVSACKSYNLPFNYPAPKTNNPYWRFNPATLDTSLRKYSKEHTIPHLYVAEFQNICTKLQNYSFIFTDGSKINNVTSYSLVTDKRIIKTSLLPEYSSVFSAEIIAILEAIKFAKRSKGNFAIVSDSLSALDSIANHNSTEVYSSIIRDLLIQENRKIKLIWVPGHSNILGNEFADAVAKQANKMPLISTANTSPNDIKKHIQKDFSLKQIEIWNSSSLWYKNLNRNKLNLHDYLHKDQLLSRSDQVKIIRLRLGYCRLTHDQVIDRTLDKHCPFCRSSTSDTTHIFLFCPHIKLLISNYFPNKSLLEILSNINAPSNKLDLINFLKSCNLYNLI